MRHIAIAAAIVFFTTCWATSAKAQDVDCGQYPNSGFCPGAAPSPGAIQGAPPFACPGYAGAPGANASGLVVLPQMLPVSCCDEIIIFGDGSVLPPHPFAERSVAQLWADEAYGSDPNTNRHYVLAWWTLALYAGVQCSGGAL